jgi:hypothetical protein
MSRRPKRPSSRSGKGFHWDVFSNHEDVPQNNYRVLGRLWDVYGTSYIKRKVLENGLNKGWDVCDVLGRLNLFYTKHHESRSTRNPASASDLRPRVDAPRKAELY